MKFTINIPDELVESFKTVTDTISKAVEDASKTAKEVHEDIREEVDSFDKEAFKDRTDEIYKEIHESLSDVETNVKETVSEGASALDNILREMFMGPQPTEAELKHEAHKKEVITKLYEQVKYVVPEHAAWFRDQVNSGGFENLDDAVLELTLPEVLRSLFTWEDSPQGAFLWKSVYKEIGGLN